MNAFQPANLKRGDIVAYIHRPDVPLKVISDVYTFQGGACVTARTCERAKSKRTHGIYRVASIAEYQRPEKADGGKKDRYVVE